MTFSQSGKLRRLPRLFRHDDGRTLILPIDDGLISGPYPSLANLGQLFRMVRPNPPDGILLFPGTLAAYSSELAEMAAIVNLTASTTHVTHSRKTMCTAVNAAVAAGADLVAVHVNVTSQYQSEMFRTLGDAIREAEALGTPVLAIMYPRREDDTDSDYQNLRQSDPDGYAQLVAHCARIGMELGADVVKTQYTGCAATFSRVVAAAHPVPVVTAGGRLCAVQDALSAAHGAIAAGARGISFGRNVFAQDDPTQMLSLLRSAVHSATRHHA